MLCCAGTSKLKVTEAETRESAGVRGARWLQSWRPIDGRRCWIHLGGKPSVNARPSRCMPFSVAAGGKSSLLAERTLDRCLSKHCGCLQSVCPAQRWNSFISQRRLTVSSRAILLLQAGVLKLLKRTYTRLVFLSASSVFLHCPPSVKGHDQVSPNVCRDLNWADCHHVPGACMSSGCLVTASVQSLEICLGLTATFKESPSRLWPRGIFSQFGLSFIRIGLWSLDQDQSWLCQYYRK